MSEHKLDKDRPNRIEEQPKLTHPLGWNCSDCFHVVKQSSFGKTAMKCCRFPPTTQAILGSRGEFLGAANMCPAVNDGDFCGEFALVDKLPWDKVPKPDA